MVKLSIIIPYYNTYELTEKLLYQLLIQDREEVEVIVIDDGCNETRLDDYTGFKNIKVIHKENGGVSSARNTGLEIAQGDYIAFIDSDDLIMPYYVDDLLELINNRTEEIIYFNWLDINTNDIIRHPSNCAVWKAIYKREILPRFDESMKAREDYFYQQDLKEETHTRYYYDKVLYLYNSNRENSLTWKDKRGIQ